MTKYNIKYPLSLLLLILLNGSVLLAKPSSPINAGDFDGTNAGARAIGMGESFVALGNIPQAPLWNPAGLSEIKYNLFAMDLDIARNSSLDKSIITEQEPLRGRKLTYVTFVSPDASLFFRPLSNYSQTTVTDASDPDNNFTETSVEVFALGISASQANEDGLQVGLSLSYLNGRLGIIKAETGSRTEMNLDDGHGFALDLGLKKKINEFSSFGFSILNAPGMMYWDDYKHDQLPAHLRIGLAYYPIPVFTFTADYEKKYYHRDAPKADIKHFGAEYIAAPWLSVRMGIFGEDLNESSKVNHTAGLSINSPKGHTFEFALKRYTIQSEYVYNYLVSISFPLQGYKEPKE